jgi:hypothetical protein
MGRGVSRIRGNRLAKYHDGIPGPTECAERSTAKKTACALPGSCASNVSAAASASTAWPSANSAAQAKTSGKMPRAQHRRATQAVHRRRGLPSAKLQQAIQINRMRVVRSVGKHLAIQRLGLRVVGGLLMTDRGQERRGNVQHLPP